MDTLYLVIVGAIGWTGFIGCVWAMKTKRHIELRVFTVEPTPEVFNGTPYRATVSAFESEPRDMYVPSDTMVVDGARIKIPVPPDMLTQTIIEPEIPEEMHRLAELAEPLLDQYDTVPQSGEWKRHQVYAAMLKNPKVKEIIGDDKWKAGFALELAVAQRRMNAEEVGA